MMAAQQLESPVAGRDSPGLIQEQPATAAEMQGFFDHLFAVLSEIGFLRPDHPRKMSRRLKRLFNKAQLEKVEVNILRGILSTMQKKTIGIIVTNQKTLCFAKLSPLIAKNPQKH